MDQSSIKEILALNVHQEAREGLSTLDKTILHKDYILQDLEPFKAQRNRFRGLFTTNMIEDFARYVNHYKPTEEAIIFIHPDHLIARIALNMGTLDAPGQCDHVAKLIIEYSAEMNGLDYFKNKRHDQKTAAELLEDWRAFITFFDEDYKEIPFVKAINALRKMTLSHSKSMESEERSFKAERSTFEKVEAKAEVMPAFFEYKVHPHAELSERIFKHRISVIGGDGIKFGFKPIQPELVHEAIQNEFMGLIDGEFADENSTIKTLIGEFKP